MGKVRRSSWKRKEERDWYNLFGHIMRRRKGETLPDEQNVYRVKVVMAFMHTGIPIAKLDCHCLRDLLQENGYRLSDTRHMLDLVHLNSPPRGSSVVI